MRRFLALTILPLTLILVDGCKTPPPDVTTTFDPAKLHAIDEAIDEAVADHKVPGAVFWLERNGVSYHKAYGFRALEPDVEPMTEDTIFDAASLTKVIATTPAVMLLIERGQLDLDAPVQRYIEEFRRAGKDDITLRHLLTHTSGLKAGLSTKPSGSLSAIQIACQEKVTNAPGTFFRYSDINFILLGEIVHRVSGRPLENFARQEIFRPLKMIDTAFLPLLPDKETLARIAPTQRDSTNMLRGVVHDPTARRMENVAGHAGLFTTAADLARFARMMLNQGELEGVRLFRPETVKLMTSVQSSPVVRARRGLGWDIDSAYSGPRGELFPIGSYGHTGFTGGSIWIDPFSKTVVILLTSRVHPDGKGNVLPLRHTVGTLAAEAVLGFNFTNVRGAMPARTNQVSSVRP